jgi:hypothetical protein
MMNLNSTTAKVAARIRDFVGLSRSESASATEMAPHPAQFRSGVVAEDSCPQSPIRRPQKSTARRSREDGTRRIRAESRLGSSGCR